MKRRIATQLLKLHQSRRINNPHPFQSYLSNLSYDLTKDMIIDIKRPFKNICIHGKQPEMILSFLKQHNRKFKVDEKDIKVTLVDYLRCESKQALLGNGSIVKEVRYVGGPDLWIPEENCYDLLISSLETYHSNDEEDLFKKYLRSLVPDGALVGTSFVQGTLHQLFWAYLMAENQRYGGMSPKVLSFPSLGETGTYLTNSQYQLVTILQHEEIIQMQSFVDLLTLLQELGQSGFLRGRRKGIFKDLLISAAALYHGQFQKQNRIQATFAISKFIGWKYHESQPKKIRPGKQVGSIEFSDQLRKFGDQVEDYVISEDSEEPKRVK